MKTIISNMTLLMCLTLSQLAPLNVQAGFGPGGGNGGDNVEPLFINAKKETVALLNEITTENVDSLNMDEPYKSWLKSASNLSHLQFYANAMILSFQDRPCDENKKPRSTSYFTGKNGKPIMCISYSYNRETTPEQAIALVIHEAGHFTGEKDHIFLSSLGVQLASQNTNKEESFIVPGPMAFMHTSEVFATCRKKYKTCFLEQDGDTQVIKGTNRFISNTSLIVCGIGTYSGDGLSRYVIWFSDAASGTRSGLVAAGNNFDEALITANKYMSKNLCSKIEIH